MSFNDKALNLYQHAVNKIDDYFEYRMESERDKARVREFLTELTSELANIAVEPDSSDESHDALLALAELNNNDPFHDWSITSIHDSTSYICHNHFTEGDTEYVADTALEAVRLARATVDGALERYKKHRAQADQIVEALFETESQPDDKCQRIQFMGGSYPNNETKLGGYGRSGLKSWLTDQLLSLDDKGGDV